MEWVRKREKSIPTFINFDGNFWGNQRLKENAAFLIFWSEIWQCTCQTHTSSHSAYIQSSNMWERENMAENQTPHPDHILTIFSMRAIRTETFAVSLVIILSMTFPSFFLISDKRKTKTEIVRICNFYRRVFLEDIFVKFYYEKYYWALILKSLKFK